MLTQINVDMDDTWIHRYVDRYISLGMYLWIALGRYLDDKKREGGRERKWEGRREGTSQT